jgi:phosphoribosylformylglycinamidine synthase I
MSPKVGVIRFPGTNCEFDTVEAIDALGGAGEILWHGDTSLGDIDALVVPGGFAHGDYLRPGAIARFSKIMDSVVSGAVEGMPIVGICNGFQVLTEAGLLPGALQKNAGLKFINAPQLLRVESTNSVLTSAAEVGQQLSIPINHFEGNFTCSPETLAELRANDQIVLTYVDNPNGSMADIAGVCNEARNVVGLMPHPERASHRLLGSEDGNVLLRGLLQSVAVAV